MEDVSETPVFNALDSTSIGQIDASYVDKLSASNTCGLILAVSVSQPQAAALASLATFVHAIHAFPKLAVVASIADYRSVRSAGRIGVFLGFEDSLAVGESVSFVGPLKALGVTCPQVTYQRRNAFGDGCGETEPAGLSNLGRELVRQCNDVGILLDVSHCSAPTTLEVARMSRAPIAATHVGCRVLVDVVRNKTDDEIRAIAATGGFIGIAAKSGFLAAGGADKGTDVSDYVRHLEHIVQLVGVEHAVIGTDIGDERKYTRDFAEGVRRRFPEIGLVAEDLDVTKIHPAGIGGPGEVRNIVVDLVRRGWTPEQVRAVAHGNAERVLMSALHD